MPDLIVTNGDTAADLLRAAGKQATILPWQDVLHEGPIVGGPIEACSAERVAYLARRFRIPEAEVAATFADRDAIMRRHGEFDRIELWFEHDLYDQLQLIQILAFLADVNRNEGVVLVQADDFLGPQRPDTILRFEEHARLLTDADRALGASVWADLGQPTPEAVVARLDQLDGRLPFLKPALLRFLEELPAPESGLGRTETAILSGIKAGTTSPRDLFPGAIRQEEAAFMGDSSFFALLDDLASCEVPLIAGLAPPAAADDDRERFDDAELELTMAGDDVLSGEADHVALSGIDRWWAGTRLLGRDVWRYDREARVLRSPVGQGELAL
jgi:hypothetical protein